MAILGEVKAWKEEMEDLEWEVEVEEDPTKINGRAMHFTIRTNAGVREDSPKCLNGKISIIATFPLSNFTDNAGNVKDLGVSIAME